MRQGRLERAYRGWQRRVHLATETRIRYFGTAARRKFRLYWTFVGPFSGLIRRALLRGVRRRAQA